MKLSTILFSFLFGVNSLSFAQQAQEKELQIGDTLVFAICSGENYQFIDLYTKTRFEDTTATYDIASGEGFYDYFFTKGDFDIVRLPCSYKNTKAVISAIQVVGSQGEEIRTVIFATLINGVKVAWIEAEKAFESGEVAIH